MTCKNLSILKDACSTKYWKVSPSSFPLCEVTKASFDLRSRMHYAAPPSCTALPHSFSPTGHAALGTLTTNIHSDNFSWMIKNPQDAKLEWGVGVKMGERWEKVKINK